MLARTPKPGLALKPGLEQPAGARLPYARHLDEATIQLRDGRLMQVLRLRGFPFETADSDELNYRKTVRETMLRGVGNPRFALYHHIVRREVEPQFDGAFPDSFSRSLDAAWRARLSVRKLYVNDLFLTLVRRPAPGRLGLLQGALNGLARASDRHEAAASQARERAALNGARDLLLSALEPYGARLLAAYSSPTGRCSEPLEFLSLLFNGELRPVLEPSGDVGLYLPYRRVSFGADTLELGPSGDLARSFAAMVSLKDYPAQTAPGMLDDLLRLPAEMVISESFAFVDRQAALDRMNLALRRMRAADDEALSLRNDLTAAKDDVAAGRSAFGEHHLTVMVRGDSPEAASLAAADVQTAFTELGAISVREDVNLEAAFWAQFPGNFKFIARRALISSGNFASLASGHNFPVGQAQGNHWGPAVTLLETTSAGPYYFNFHKGDLGNFTVIGPSGAGKTVVLAFLLAQAQKLSPRTVYFDKDRGAEIFLRAIGGRYDLIRPGRTTGFNPLLLADGPENRRFLCEWVVKLVSRQGEILSAEDLAQVADAVDANFAQPPQLRRLRYFAELFRGRSRPSAADLAARLAPWCEGGDYAWLFDNPEDRLDLDASTLGFDMTQVLDDPAARTPVMMYLFHRVEQRLDGRPTIIVIDEGWKALDDPAFVHRIKDWEKTIRKRNGVVGFCTQSASDALSSQIASAIIEQAATQIFMINPKAQAEDYCGGFGLTAHELDIIRTLPDAARCFLIKHGTDSVVARLDLSGMPGLLTVLSGRESSVRRLDEIRAEVGDDPAAWLPLLQERA
ncbi:VirB4 family type IV secretion/conjugal transfer ATPase [Phenylobacterium montanum]|uniref:Type IV secretion system protein virB4 n=1 Tax=Phenylobacterium montanum TaxID=2823693 RepID=A0A975G343_9CAUL|nr:VirB4 family type IV secretion system protein [Caulobacter sp. S6]QUD89811.1 VirB4 family type IV secretion system protein [Caulobacter sp. S6]